MHDAGLDLRALAALDALVRLESVSKAARELGVSQPTMSRTLGRLRDVVGDALLVRSGNRMVPTPRAKEIAEVARRALRSIDEAVQRSVFEPATSTRHFRLAAWDYVQRLLLGPLLRRVHAEAPRVSVEVVPVRDRSPVDALEAEAIELSVGLHRGLREDYRRRGLFSDRFVVCAHPDHPIWERPLTPERLADAPQLLVAPFGATRAGVVDLALRQLGLERRVVAFVDSFSAAPELIREAGLVATLPARLAQADPELRAEDAPLPLPEFEIECVWHGSVHADEGHAWLRRHVAAAAQRLA